MIQKEYIMKLHFILNSLPGERSQSCVSQRKGRGVCVSGFGCTSIDDFAQFYLSLEYGDNKKEGRLALWQHVMEIGGSLQAPQLRYLIPSREDWREESY